MFWFYSWAFSDFPVHSMHRSWTSEGSQRDKVSELTGCQSWPWTIFALASSAFSDGFGWYYFLYICSCYFEVYICLLLPIIGHDDFVLQICTLTSKQEAYCIKTEGLFPVYAYTVSSHTMLLQYMCVGWAFQRQCTLCITAREAAWKLILVNTVLWMNCLLFSYCNEFNGCHCC